MSSVLEMKIIALLQDDIPTTENPYATMAKLLQISEDELVEKLKSLQQEGKLKRIAAILHHQQAGYAENAMVVFNVDLEEVDNIGRLLAESPLVSHCYRRQSYPDWPYNLYAMCHSRDSDAITLMVEAFAKKHGVTDFLVLPSVEELKKTSLRFSQ